MFLRLMFINYGPQVDVQVTARENVILWQCGTSTNAEAPEVKTGFQSLNGTAERTWTFTLTAGGIHGFAVTRMVDYVNPDAQHIQVITATNKDPWPPPPPPPPLLSAQPPPPPSQFQHIPDYPKRYQKFLMALGVDTPDKGDPIYVSVKS